jgi:hypothetical protein
LAVTDAGNICAAATIKSPKVEDPAADYLWPAPQSSGASGPAASSVEPVRTPSWPVSLVQRLPVACRAVRGRPQLGSIPARIARSGFPASATGRHVCNTQSRSDAQPASANFPAMIRPRRAIPGPAHPFNSDGGAGGVCRDVSTMSVDVSAEDFRPRCLMAI